MATNEEKMKMNASYGKGESADKRNTPRPKVDRKVIHTFTDDKTKISIRITQLPLVPWPQYSMLFGTIMEDERFLPFASIRRSSSLAGVDFEYDYEVIIGRMLVSAMSMIHDLMKADIKTYIESRYDRDHERALATFAKGAKKAGTHGK